ncbi:hypothetical protein N7444_010831 [Penicillium canescens]|nr:hypothetical protein N7444_010831 [Penicillium canescens]
MLRQAIQGARWCQHVARSPSCVPRQAFSAAAPRRLNYGGPNDKVNFYEQESLHSKNRRKVNPEAEDHEVRDRVEQELVKLQDELKVMEGGPFGPNSEFITSLPEAERKIALEALRKYDEENPEQANQPGLEEVFDQELDDMVREEFEGLAMEQENWEDGAKRRRSLAARRSAAAKRAGADSHPYAVKFNNSLRQYQGNMSDERARQELWKWYRRCKQTVPHFLSIMPEGAMEAIWNSQATGEIEQATRSTHLRILVQDATSLGQALTTPQILSYITSLHDDGATNLALEQWEAYQTELSQEKEDLEEYWKLGVRLFAAEGNPQRAQDIALAFLANDRHRQPRVLIPIIIAWGSFPERKPK